MSGLIRNFIGILPYGRLNKEEYGGLEVKNFIFIIGTSGIGKTTLGKGLFAHYNGAFVEQNMVPEFGIPKNVDEGVFEEQVCWECCVAQMMKFHEMGIKNIIGSDFDYESQRKCSDKVNKRPLLINEVEIDVTNKTSQQVLDEAIKIIDNTETLMEYSYQKTQKDLFYSWVFSNGLQ